MLWRLRKEIIFLILLFLSVFIEKKYLSEHSGNTQFVEKEKLLNYEEILEENKRLREILDLKEKKTFSNFKVAEVIGINPYIFPAEIFIDKGKRDGIEPNMIVISKELFLIGKVEQVDETYSKVISIFNSKSRISSIISTTGEIGIVEGGYGPFLIMKYIPYDSKVKIGDEIFTSGYSEYYISGLKIGKVYKIQRKSDSLFLDIWVKPYITNKVLKETIVGK